MKRAIIKVKNKGKYNSRVILDNGVAILVSNQDAFVNNNVEFQGSQMSEQDAMKVFEMIKKSVNSRVKRLNLLINRGMTKEDLYSQVFTHLWEYRYFDKYKSGGLLSFYAYISLGVKKAMMNIFDNANVKNSVYDISLNSYVSVEDKDEKIDFIVSEKDRSSLKAEEKVLVKQIYEYLYDFDKEDGLAGKSLNYQSLFVELIQHQSIKEIATKHKMFEASVSKIKSEMVKIIELSFGDVL